MPAPVTASHGSPAASSASRAARASRGGRLDRAAPFLDAAAMLRGSEVRLQPAQVQARLRGDRARERDRGAGIGDARAVVADVEFDVDVEARRRAIARLAKRLDDRRVVHADAEARGGEAGGERGQVRELARADDLVGHQHVGDAAGEEGLRFRGLLHADADGARGDLPPRDLDALVALGVRPHADVASGHGLHQASRCWRRTGRGRRSVPACRRRPARRRGARGSSVCPCGESSECGRAARAP